MNRNKNRSVSYYRVIPMTVRVGVPQTVTVYPLGKTKSFNDNLDYTVKFIPMEAYDYTWVNTDAPDYDTVTVHPVNGVISVTYNFESEQQWVISIAPTIPQTPQPKIPDFQIYALNDDLYALNPYMGDLHVHSARSDGKEDPVIVAANYRKEGFDFFALTDHHKWEPSKEMIDAYADIPLGIKMFNGEEVHIPHGWIHIVNFGGKYSVNSLYRSDSERYDREIREMAKGLNTPKGVNAVEFAYRKWTVDEIRRAGGLAIATHPNWITRQVYNMSDRMLDYVFETDTYDAFELIGGQSSHENNMQIAFYHEQRAIGRNIPIVGSSDSHGTDPASWFGVGRTVVFSKDTELDSLCDAIKNGYSVAIEQQYGEDERVYGSYRMVKYARFLLDYYFPSHNELCVEEGILMREYALGNEEAGNSLRSLADRTEKHMKKILRGE